MGTGSLQANPIETRRQAMQAEIDVRRSAAERNRLGQFATPHLLALDIARYVESLMSRRQGGIRFADPAIGSGSFYSAALTVFGARRIDSAIGIELDADFCRVARDLWGGAGLDVLHGDFTRLVANGSPSPAPNLILANPPYVRHHHIDREDKKRLRRLTYELTGIDVNGLAGLYVYFLLLATAWMEADGIAAWLIPSEFMDVNYGAALKSFLTERVTLLRAHRFDPDDVQFGDALVSSVVLVFRKTPPKPGHSVEFTFGGSLHQPETRELVSIDRLVESRKWTVYPRDPIGERPSATDLCGPKLSDFFRVRRGIATGRNKFFILDRAEATRLNLPVRFLRPILPSPRHFAGTVIESGDDQYPLIDKQYCLIDCDLPESAVKADHASLWAYLESADESIRNGYLVRKRSPWYKQEQREAAPFLCTYMGRSKDGNPPFRFIWNRSQAIATNLYLMLYPQGVLRQLLREDPDRGRDVLALLGRVTGAALRAEGRVYGGGLYKIEPRELGRVSAETLVEGIEELRLSKSSPLAPMLFPL